VIVLDASAAIEWLIKSPEGTKVDRRLFSFPHVTLHAPHLLDTVIAKSLWRQGIARGSRLFECGWRRGRIRCGNCLRRGCGIALPMLLPYRQFS
jgi:hypothetical protein